LGGQHGPTNGQANGPYATSFLRRKGRRKKAIRYCPAQGRLGYKGGAFISAVKAVIKFVPIQLSKHFIAFASIFCLLKIYIILRQPHKTTHV
jgi:hypothetical protein